MAKYFYIYSVAGGADSIVKMFNTDTGTVGTRVVEKDRLDGFVDGIKASGYAMNKELADADVAEEEAKRKLAIAMDAYHKARDTYSEAKTELTKVMAKYNITIKQEV